MSEVILLLVIIVLAGLLAYRERENRIERGKLINALMSKNAAELANLEFVDRVKPQDTKPILDPMVATADMSDEEFDKFIEETNKNAN